MDKIHLTRPQAARLVMIACKEAETTPIMEAIVKVAHLDVPGHGIAYVSPIYQAIGLFSVIK